MFDNQVWAFVLIAFLITITPGADTMLVVRSVLARGRRAGFAAMWGVITGGFIHACLAAFGITAILLNSVVAFQVVKTAGALYLMYLGIGSIRSALNKTDSVAHQDQPVPMQLWRSYTEGIISNVLNPKIVVFYLAFLPQFLSPGDPVVAKSFLLVGIHYTMGIVWFSAVTLLVSKMSQVFAGSVLKKSLELFSGAIFIAFGARLAFERR